MQSVMVRHAVFVHGSLLTAVTVCVVVRLTFVWNQLEAMVAMDVVCSAR
jgi:hypothetical protein